MSDGDVSEMARILVLDEQGVYRMGLCALISTQMPKAQVLSANSLIEALPQIQTGAFDLVLLGLDLSNSETADTLMGAREASAATRFAIISASDTRGDMLAALAAGLHGFISNHQSDAKFLAPSTIFCPDGFMCLARLRKQAIAKLPLAKATGKPHLSFRPRQTSQS
jgi:DNA-binding NarL/FixJ family response regulator